MLNSFDFLSVSVLNSISLRKLISFFASISLRAVSCIGIGSGTSSLKVTNFLLKYACSSNSIIFSLLFFCFILSAFLNNPSRLPYSLISSAAVLIPIPGIPGILSTESPANDCTSITFSG